MKYCTDWLFSACAHTFTLVVSTVNCSNGGFSDVNIHTSSMAAAHSGENISVTLVSHFEPSVCVCVVCVCMLRSVCVCVCLCVCVAFCVWCVAYDMYVLCVCVLVCVLCMTCVCVVCVCVCVCCVLCVWCVAYDVCVCVCRLF